MNRKIRVGIIGTGVGLRTYLPSFRQTGHAEVVAIAGSSLERGQHFADMHGIELACADASALCSVHDLDLICVTSPPEFHVAHAMVALATDVPVIVEKPAGRNSDESAQIAHAAQSRDAWTLVNYQLRFDPVLQHARQIISSGALGRVYSLELTYRGGSLASASTPAPESWQTDASRGGGVRLSMGSHLVDLAIFLLNATPSSPRGHVNDVHELASASAATRAAPFFAASMTIENATVWVSASEAAHTPRELSIEVLGANAALRFDTATNQLRVFKHDEIVHSERSTVQRIDDNRSIFRTAFDHAAEAAVDAMRAGSERVPLAATPTENLRVMRCLDQAIAQKW